MGCMVIERRGMTEIWVPNGTPEEEVRRCVRAYKKTKNMVTIYRSSQLPVADLTCTLLRREATKL